MGVTLRQLTDGQLHTTKAYHWQQVERTRSQNVKERNRKRIRAIEAELERRRQQGKPTTNEGA